MSETQPKTRSDDTLAGIGGVPGRTEELLPQAGIVTWRSIIIGLILIPLNTYWIMEVEGIWHSGHPTAMSIMWNVVFNIFVLVLINLAIKRFAPRYALTQSEFIIIYVMLSLASALAGHDTLQLGIPAMTHGWCSPRKRTNGHRSSIGFCRSGSRLAISRSYARTTRARPPSTKSTS